jgi:phage terminase large subunit
VAAEGLIYEEFNPAYHVVDKSSVPMSWPRFWSIDFGFNHPFVLQCWAEDPDGRLYLYKEIYHTQRTVDEHAETILRATERDPKPQFILADHDAENRARFENKIGQGTRLADKRVLHGIQMVQARLKVQKDGMPRILLMRDAVIDVDLSQKDAGKPASTLEEITSYVWAKSDSPGKKEQPVKLNDDGMDAMRYICAERDPMLLPKIRFM